MRSAGVLQVWCRIGDEVFEDDERGLVGHLLGGLDRLGERGHIFGDSRVVIGPVDHAHIPTVGLVALGHILGESNIGVVFDRDAVRVINRDESAQLLVSGHRTRL